MRIVALDEPWGPAWAALFAACGCACFCRWWHFEGNRNEWLARCAHEPERNREEQLARVRLGAPEAGGLLALHDGAVVGWMKLAPASSLPKLVRQGPYRLLERAERDATFSIGCLLVHPAHRRKGVARGLVEASVDHARACGGRAIEAYPRRADYDLYDEEAWMGTPRLFAACGFREVGGEGPYPLMRKELDP